MPPPSNIATPTIYRGTARPSLHQIKRLRCLAPTLKHRHTHDM
ncbi:hypothetical protein [Microseira wollei]|nr:hypothetical protein [Microseira wollei]